MWSRRDLGRWCASAALGASLPVALAQTRSTDIDAAPALAPRFNLGRVIVAVDNKASFDYLPLTIAERLGYFSLEGLDLQVREFSEPEQALQAVLSGAAQLVSGPYSNTISAHLRGQPMRSIVLQGRTPPIALGVSMQTLPHFRQLRDLRGRRIAVTSIGSASHRVARLLMTRVGIGPQDVSYQVFPGYLATTEAFRTGLVDAVCYDDPMITQLERAGELRLVADMRSVRGSVEVFGGPMPAGCVSALDGFVVGNPRQCQAIAHGIVHALKWLQTAGPSDLIKTVPESHFLGDWSLYLAVFSRAREALAPDGMMPMAGPQTAMNLIEQFGDAKARERVNLANTFTNVFATAAKLRFRA